MTQFCLLIPICDASQVGFTSHYCTSGMWSHMVHRWITFSNTILSYFSLNLPICDPITNQTTPGKWKVSVPHQIFLFNLLICDGSHIWVTAQRLQKKPFPNTTWSTSLNLLFCYLIIRMPPWCRKISVPSQFFPLDSHIYYGLHMGLRLVTYESCYGLPTDGSHMSHRLVTYESCYGLPTDGSHMSHMDDT